MNLENKLSKIKWELGTIGILTLIYSIAGSTVTSTEVKGSAKPYISEESIKEEQEKRIILKKALQDSIENAKAQDEKLINALNKDIAFYRLVSDNSHSQVTILGATDSPNTWRKYLNLTEEDYKEFLTDQEGDDLLKTLLANSAIFTLGEWKLEQQGDIGESVLTKKTQEDASFYTGVVHDSYKRAIGAHFKGTHSDWENVLKEQDMILIKAINQKSSLPLERKKYFIALGAWNEVFSHKTADQIFRESYKQGKSLGFKGGIHSWAIGLKSKDKNSAGTAWPVVYNFIDLQTWDALYAPSKYNLGLNYKGKSKLQMFTIRRKNNREYEYKSYESPLSLMINSSKI